MPSINRRTFLRGACGSALLAPFATLPTRLAHADGPAPLRLVVFFSPNGTIHDHWRPTVNGNTFSFPAGSILEPLASIQDKLVVIDGLNFVNATNHEGGMGAMLTGGGAPGVTGGKSLDQYVAAELASPTRFSSMELGVLTSNWGGSTQTRMSYSGANSFVTPDDRPSNVFSRLFGDADLDAQSQARIRTHRRSVLDFLRGDIQSIRARTSPTESLKLDQHLEAFRRLELQFQEPQIDSCSGPVDIGVPNAYQNDSFPMVGQQQMELLVNALACDMTRVASLQWSHTVSPIVFSWLGQSQGHHTLSHAGNGDIQGVGDFVAAERWFAEQFLAFVNLLDERSDPLGPGSLLDNSLVVWAKEMGDSRLHVCDSVPFVLAGGANFPFTRNRYIDAGGAAHNHLLVSLSQAMGLSNTTFGDPTAGEGPLQGLV